MRIRAGLPFPQLAHGLLLIAASVMALVVPVHADTFWLLRAGRELWADGRLSFRESWSHTATGRFWPNHEWLWEAIAYPFHGLGGLPLLTLFGAGWAMLGVALSLRLTVGRPWTRFALALLTIPCIVPLWALRPQITTLALVAVLLWLLARERWPWVPVLFLLWANLHAGVALGGIVLGGALLAAAALALRERTRENRRRVLVAAVAVAASGGASTLTPLGPGIFGFVIESTARLRAFHVVEWERPSGLLGVWFWAAAALLVGLAVLRAGRLRAWPEGLLVAAALVLVVPASLVQRNIPVFMLAALPAASRLLGPDVELPFLRPSAAPDRPRANLAILMAAGALAAGAVLALWITRHHRLGWDPISPATAAAVQRCPGPLYNTYYEGGYLLWFAPGVRVSIDNRQDPYPPDLVREHLAIERGADWRPLFERLGIRCAALPVTSATAPRLRGAGWRVLHQDARWIVLAL